MVVSGLLWTPSVCFSFLALTLVVDQSLITAVPIQSDTARLIESGGKASLA